MPDTAPAQPSPLGIAAPHRELLDQLFDKWSPQVLELLCDSPRRFSELRRSMPTVTAKSLTATLRRLERNGIVERLLVSSRPVAVEYRITPLGKTLREPIDVLLEWVGTHLASVESARARFDRDELTGQAQPG